MLQQILYLHLLCDVSITTPNPALAFLGSSSDRKMLEEAPGRAGSRTQNYCTNGEHQPQTATSWGALLMNCPASCPMKSCLQPCVATLPKKEVNSKRELGAGACCLCCSRAGFILISCPLLMRQIGSQECLVTALCSTSECHHCCMHLAPSPQERALEQELKYSQDFVHRRYIYFCCA